MAETKRATKTNTVPLHHEVRSEWQHLCFLLAECICGEVMWALEQRDLNAKWKAHLE